MAQLPVPILSYADLQKRATDFLEEWHPSDEIPVPIEEIIDLRSGIDIVPAPGLHSSFDIDAFITSDLTTIFVDQSVYESRPGRYRFSLAHELAHLLLHGEVFRQLRFSSISEWKLTQQQIDREDHRWLEWQAYALAGLILVPSDPLRRRFDEIASSLRDDLAGDVQSREDTGREALEEACLQAISKHLADEFVVSAAVIEKRLRKDDLWELELP